MVDRLADRFRGLKADIEDLLHRIETARSNRPDTD
jgi:hypothetical protein